MSGSNIHLRSIVRRENSPASSVRQTQQGFTISINHLEFCDSRIERSLGGVEKRKCIHGLFEIGETHKGQSNNERLILPCFIGMRSTDHSRVGRLESFRSVSRPRLNSVRPWK